MQQYCLALCLGFRGLLGQSCTVVSTISYSQVSSSFLGDGFMSSPGRSSEYLKVSVAERPRWAAFLARSCVDKR